MKKAPKGSVISTVLRNHLAAAGSVNAIAQAAGVSQPSLSRFLRGGDLKLATVDKLATHLGLTLGGAA